MNATVLLSEFQQNKNMLFPGRGKSPICPLSLCLARQAWGGVSCCHLLPGSVREGKQGKSSYFLIEQWLTSIWFSPLLFEESKPNGLRCQSSPSQSVSAEPRPARWSSSNRNKRMAISAKITKKLKTVAVRKRVEKSRERRTGAVSGCKTCRNNRFLAICFFHLTARCGVKHCRFSAAKTGKDMTCGTGSITISLLKWPSSHSYTVQGLGKLI